MRFFPPGSEQYERCSGLIRLLKCERDENGDLPRVEDLFVTDPALLKALLIATFAGQIMIASTRIKSDDEVAMVTAKASKKKAQKKAETFTKAEQGIREMLDANLDPRECVSMPLEIPRGISMHNFHERLCRTLAMVCSEEVEVVPQDSSYRKVFIRFGKGKSLADGGVGGSSQMRAELE